MPLAAGGRRLDRAPRRVRGRTRGIDTASVDHITATDRRIPDGHAIDDSDVHARDVGVTDPLDRPLALPVADRGLDPDAAADSTDAQADGPADTQANAEADAHADTRTAVAQPARHPRVAHGQ